MYEEFKPLSVRNGAGYAVYVPFTIVENLNYKQGMSSVYIVGKPVLHNLFRSLGICSWII